MKAQQNKKQTKKSTNPFPSMEEEVLNFWDKNKIFTKSVERDAPKGDYVFYDGPPFATGTPHYGHIVASIMKDVVPRYWTMQGYKVERKWGWDCHGLPIENIVEKELGFKSKKDIEDLGITKFNETCRSKVLTYVDEWQKVIRRLGRWADMENAYKTMDKDYMESIWWVFKELFDKGLVYEGYKSMHICPRCETTLSQMEVTEGYKDVKDISVVVKFELKDEPGTFVLVWTTTPWTLPGNVALAINPKEKYVKVKENSEETYILAKDRLLADAHFQILEEIDTSELIGKQYKPLFPYYDNKKLDNHQNAFKIYGADFVNMEEGTGVVHIAPAFGEDDMNLGKQENLPFVQHVNMDGHFKEEVKDFANKKVRPKDDPHATDMEIIKYLEKKNFFRDKEEFEHSYPHCWRCETPLLNYATSSWFVNVAKIKNKALQNAKDINWTPSHIKEGRFGQWLEGARDWSISRQRFWASVMPIWKCDSNRVGTGQCPVHVIGSVKELEDLSGKKVDDLHKHVIDEITFPCEKCKGTMKRIPDVLDTWFDSGSMPYAQMHYDFENKEKFENNFPAEFIAEGVDQTRAWFYYLHVIATAIKNKPAFKNVIVNGIVLAEDGKKMSKRLQNYPDPMEVMEKHGADKLRYYLCSAPVVKAENLNFSEKDLLEQTRFFNILLNVLTFYKMFAQDSEVGDLEEKDLVNVLDKWIISRLEETKKTVTEKMNNYDLHSIRKIPIFIDDLSTWYIRRSRNRFKGDDKQDKQNALITTKYVLTELAKIMAPFMPFTAEKIWQEITGNDFKKKDKSVHLESFSVIKKIDERVLAEMEQVRRVVELGLAYRDEKNIKIRQPLAELIIKNHELRKRYEDLVKDELNVKNIKTTKGEGELSVELDTKLTPELKLEGIKRELVRAINNARKNSGMTIQDRATIFYQTDSKDIKEAFEKFGEEIKKDTLADKAEEGGGGKSVAINKDTVELKVERITRNA